MTEDKIIKIIEIHFSYHHDQLFYPINIFKKEFISAMREAIQIGIDKYVINQKGYVFNIWEIEQRKKLLEAMRLESIGFAEWGRESGWNIYSQNGKVWAKYGEWRYVTTDQLYNEYLQNKK